MPFRLKNAGSTYQRLVNKICKHQSGKNMELYVDDMLVKSVKENDDIKDLQDDFTIMKKYDTKLNPKNVSLGYLREVFKFYSNEPGIEANSDMIKAS